MAALGASQARVPRAAVDGIDLVCPQVHTKVHMRDLPPPRETRSAAALIGVRDIGHRKSEPVIVSVRGVDLLTNKPRKMGNVWWFIETSLSPSRGSSKITAACTTLQGKSRFMLTIRLPRPPHAPSAQVGTCA
ncbi:hypothetical protein GGI42DRAFT_67966 [Trichoderma sp. SZMC 28013]